MIRVPPGFSERMDLSEIHFHDSQIRRVIELPARDEIHLEVDYPVDWEREVYEPRVIVFADVLDYAVHEGPFGTPFIMSVSELEQDEGRTLLRIDTTAGFRLLRCAAVELRTSTLRRFAPSMIWYIFGAGGNRRADRSG